MALFQTTAEGDGECTETLGSQWLLSTFPSEVVGSIAEFAGIRGVANLWCCGSILLNQKLSSIDGIQQIVIDDRRFTLGDWFPRDLQLLNGVKTIQAHFRSAFHPSLATLILPLNLASLSHLETIDFSFEEVLTCWKIENNKTSSFSFQQDLPSLTALQLQLPSVRLAPRLGGNVYRDSSIEQATDFVTSHLGALPIALTRLSLDFPFQLASSKLQELSCLPKTLEDLLLGVQKGVKLSFASKLPFLTRLNLPRLETAIFDAKEGEMMPILTLRDLSMPLCTNIVSSSSSSSFTGNLFFNLLPKLQKLEIYWMTGVHWHQIPCWHTLTHFKIHCQDELFSPLASVNGGFGSMSYGSGFFPPALLVLDMQHVKPTRATWVAFLRNAFEFPLSLLELYLPRIELAPSMMSKLPQQLEQLGLCWTRGAEHLIAKNLSPNLKVLHAFENYQYHSGGLSSFSSCEEHLPSTLTRYIDSFSVYTNVNGRFFDPTLAARYNNPFALDYLIQHGCPATIDAIYDVRTLWTAIRHGSMKVLEWIETQNPDLLFAYRCADAQPSRHRSENIQNLMKASILYQQLGALQWLHRLGFSFTPISKFILGKMKSLGGHMTMEDNDIHREIQNSNISDSLFNLPLAIAIEYDNVEICAYLIKNFPMEAIWRKRRKIQKRKIVAAQKGRKRTSSTSSHGSNRSNGSQRSYHFSDHSDDDYELVEVIAEENLAAVAEAETSDEGSSDDPDSIQTNTIPNSDVMEEEEDDTMPGTPLTLALIWNKLLTMQWLINQGYTGLSWKIILKITLKAGSLVHLSQLSEMGFEIPKKRHRLIFEAFCLYPVLNPVPILKWLANHGLDPTNVRRLLPRWESGHYNLEKSAPKSENLAIWLFRHFHTRQHQIGKQGLLQLCQWLHELSVNIFLPGDDNSNIPFIIRFAQELKDQNLLEWLKSTQNA